MENKCVVCNEIIPEGRMICPLCERCSIKTGMILQSCQSTQEEVKQAYAFMKRKENKDGENV